MDFTFTPEQQTFKKQIHEFLEKECPKEYVRELDEEERYPYELYAKWVKAGWFALPYPAEYGGRNGTATDLMILAEEIAYFGGYDMGGAYVTPVFCGLNLVRHGTEEQKAYFLPKLIKGEVRFCISMTEPGAGSDSANISTSAVPDGDDYVLNGQKVFTTAADVEGAVLHLTARTDRTVPKHRGMTVFIVDVQLPGMEVRRLRTLGRRIVGTCEVFLRDVRVPKTRVMGGLNQGWQTLMSNMELERMCCCACYVGNMQVALDEALAYAKERKQFGQPIGRFQAISHMLADMLTDVEGARLLTYRAASMIDHGIPCVKEVSMAKLFGAEAFLRIAGQGMQIMGGQGYLVENNMERHFREARGCTITAGTSQVQRNIIARFAGL
ncbi:MAG: acyl-CoA/acyl-ACP dehydrogenase [Chloroflexi bacterium]|nr:acyl-CoA/acyl-ACP dehydrogenase [Chloroflexota bacterium]